MAQHANADASPPDGARPAPFTGRFAEIDGRRLHYLEYYGSETARASDSRPTMLCVHGGAAHGHWFDYIAPYFSAGYRVLALDQRGHGNSDWVDPPAYSYQDYAADLAAFADRLDLRDFVLVGHSMGGMVSLVHTATYPGRVGRLVIVDTSIKLSEERLSAMRDRGSRPGSSYATREELIARYRMMPAGTQAPPETVRYIASHSAQQFPDGSWRHKFDRSVYAIRESIDGMPYWGRIRIPALIVKGSFSERITPEIFAGIKAHCPQAELAEVAGANHHVTLDNPSGFAQAVNAFLARHPLR